MANDDNLRNLRQRIDRIDKNILRLLDERMTVSQRVANVKDRRGLALYDEARERKIMSELSERARHPQLRAALASIYEPILALSKTVQTARRLQIHPPPVRGLTIGIIGYGRFGVMLAGALRKYWPAVRLMVFSRSHPIDKSMFFSLANVAAADILIPCVPISSLPAVLRDLKPFLRKETTVIDVCSVKVMPARWLRKILGADASIIASHPMFGPDSTEQGRHFSGLIMVLHNISAPVEIYETWAGFWQRLGVVIVDLPPQEHDRYAACTMNYSHLIGRIGELTGIHSTPIDTKDFANVYQVMEHVINDSWELFYDMQKYNPYSAAMRRKVARALAVIEKKLL